MFVARPLAVALAVFAAGCGGGTGLVPVSGSVTHNGKPAAGAMLIFHPDPPAGDLNAVPPTATVGADGSFTLTSGTAPGAKPGSYVVTVVWPDPNKKLSDAQKMMGVNPHDAPDVLAGRYATRDKSPLRATVGGGPTALPAFELK